MGAKNKILKIIFCSCLVLFFVSFVPLDSIARLQASRSIKLTLRDQGGKDQEVPLYKNSYALLVGVSEYNAGWPKLEAIPSEIDKVDELLSNRGFNVTKVMNPDAETLSDTFKDFITSYGLEKENRLLFFFSGHGHTRDNGKKGYLVPVDAPDPGVDKVGFLKKALGMNQVLSWARDIESKHALFLFDSCFSGTIFKYKSKINPPKHITKLTIEPVRQFITAGSAGEEVPANSTFTPAFIDGLRYGLADLNKDGYVSATELGLYLRTEVPQHADQNPQFGKIRDYDLSRGDFIFLTDSTLHEPVSPKSEVRKRKAKIKNFGIFAANSNPPNASLYIDGRFMGATPLTIDKISEGRHEIRLEKQGYIVAKRNIQVLGGRHVTLDFELVAAKPDVGSLTVHTNPVGADIRLVNMDERYSPGMEMVAGEYWLEVTKHGYQKERLQVEVHENEDLHMNVTLNQISGAVTPDAREYEQSGENEPEQETVAQTAPASLQPEKKKMVHKAPSDSLPADIRRHIKGLNSPVASTRRNAAKVIYKQGVMHPAVLDTAEKQLLKGHLVNQKDRYHVDALAWFCNILGASNQIKYRRSLQKVAASGAHRKVKKYAEKNDRKLQ